MRYWSRKRLISAGGGTFSCGRAPAARFLPGAFSATMRVQISTQSLQMFAPGPGMMTAPERSSLPQNEQTIS